MSTVMVADVAAFMRMKASKLLTDNGHTVVPHAAMRGTSPSR